MNPNEFAILSHDQKAETVLGGVLLVAFAQGNTIMQLYSVDTLYVELCYDISAGAITAMNILNTTDQLLPYVRHITLRTALTTRTSI